MTSTGEKSGNKAPQQTRRRLTVAVTAGALAAGLTAGCGVLGGPTHHESDTIPMLSNGVERTGVISQIIETPDGIVTGAVLDQCGPNNPVIDNNGNEPPKTFLSSTVRTIVANSQGKKCHETLGTTDDGSGIDVSIVLKDVAAKNPGDPAQTVPGAVFENNNGAKPWQYMGHAPLGGYSPTVVTEAAPTSGSNNNSSSAPAAPTQIVFGIETSDSWFGTTINICGGNDNDPVLLTSKGLAEQQTMASFGNMVDITTDKAGDTTCQLTVSDMQNTPYVKTVTKQVGAIFELNTDAQGDISGKMVQVAPAGTIQ